MKLGLFPIGFIALSSLAKLQYIPDIFTFVKKGLSQIFIDVSCDGILNEECCMLHRHMCDLNIHASHGKNYHDRIVETPRERNAIMRCSPFIES